MSEELPENIIAHLRKLGRVEWGSTDAKTDKQHLRDFKKTLAITRETFTLDEKTRLDGVYLAGMSAVVCHTGNSPNSGLSACIIAGVWNQLCDIAGVPASPAEAAKGRGEEA